MGFRTCFGAVRILALRFFLFKIRANLEPIFPKRLTSRGFRNQKEGGAGFWPISPGSVSEGGAGATADYTYRIFGFFLKEFPKGI